MAPPSNTRLALDTNVIYQLAAGVPHTEKFRLLCLERGYSLLVTHTVIEEATYRTRQAKDDPQGATLAHKALTSLLEWGIQPHVLPPLDLGYAKEFSTLLRTRKLLPWEEVRDGCLLGEASRAQIPVLITADAEHLLSIERDALTLAFHDSHIGPPVTIFHPLTFIKAFATLRKPEVNPKTKGKG
ncbi:MAG: hypothetical protein LV481_16325 [Methylacidiphilales bacterium]|nr:hypothetical protein [Candidatus Methylacidiphilales bacterium]